MSVFFRDIFYEIAGHLFKEACDDLDKKSLCSIPSLYSVSTVTRNALGQWVQEAKKMAPFIWVRIEAQSLLNHPTEEYQGNRNGMLVFEGIANYHAPWYIYGTRDNEYAKTGAISHLAKTLLTKYPLTIIVVLSGKTSKRILFYIKYLLVTHPLAQVFWISVADTYQVDAPTSVLTVVIVDIYNDEDIYSPYEYHIIQWTRDHPCIIFLADFFMLHLTTSHRSKWRRITDFETLRFYDTPGGSEMLGRWRG